MILVVDFGGQYNQLIARRIRDLNIYCEVVPYNKALKELENRNNVEGIIFTGGPNSVYEEGAPQIEKEIFDKGIPVLGLCYGMQIMAHTLGGEVIKAPNEREFGKTEIETKESLIFKNLSKEETVWMSHVDRVSQVPEGFEVIAKSKNCPIAGMVNVDKKLYALQFHPEVNHSVHGKDMLENFAVEICGAKKDWTMENYAKKSIQEIKEKVGDGKVLLALSGGVDSSVTAALLSKAVGEKLTCIFVDHGLMRKNEGDEVEEAFKDSGMHFIREMQKKDF